MSKQERNEHRRAVEEFQRQQQAKRDKAQQARLDAEAQEEAAIDRAAQGKGSDEAFIKGMSELMKHARNMSQEDIDLAVKRARKENGKKGFFGTKPKELNRQDKQIIKNIKRRGKN